MLPKLNRLLLTKYLPNFLREEMPSNKFTCGWSIADKTNTPATNTRKNVVTEQNAAPTASFNNPTITIIINNEYKVDKMAA